VYQQQQWHVYEFVAWQVHMQACVFRTRLCCEIMTVCLQPDVPTHAFWRCTRSGLGCNFAIRPWRLHGLSSYPYPCCTGPAMVSAASLTTRGQGVVLTASMAGSAVHFFASRHVLCDDGHAVCGCICPQKLASVVLQRLLMHRACTYALC
jgi:hypothetical protein